MIRLIVTILLCALLVAPAIGAAQTRVFLSEEEALQRALHDPPYVHRRVVEITQNDASAYEKLLGIDLLDREYVIHEGNGADGIVRRAVVINVIGEHQPITFMVAMLPEGMVVRVEIMVYRESRGGEVRRRAFLDQFESKKTDDRIAVHQDIMNITGATLSSRAVANGVRLALMLNERLAGMETDMEARW